MLTSVKCMYSEIALKTHEIRFFSKEYPILLISLLKGLNWINDSYIILQLINLPIIEYGNIHSTRKAHLHTEVDLHPNTTHWVVHAYM